METKNYSIWLKRFAGQLFILHCQNNLFRETCVCLLGVAAAGADDDYGGIVEFLLFCFRFSKIFPQQTYALEFGICSSCRNDTAMNFASLYTLNSLGYTIYSSISTI